MTRRFVWLPLLVAGAFWWSGCGGCQSEEETKAPAPAVQPQADKPKEEAAKPAAPTAAPAQATGETEPDCFVIVDAEPDFGPPPLTVRFMTEIDCTAEPVTYSWDFGDGTSGGNEPNPTHVYDKPGDYVAVVTTKSPDGGEGEDEMDITVDAELDE
jgi:PKD repeat protein